MTYSSIQFPSLGLSPMTQQNPALSFPTPHPSQQRSPVFSASPLKHRDLALITHRPRASTLAPFSTPVAQSKKTKQQNVPKKLTSYRLTVTGTTFSGNTFIPLPETRYTPIENFRLPGVLSVEPMISKPTFKNGRNFRDVGLFVGNQPPFIGPVVDAAAGALWFATNNKIFRRLGGNFGQESALDIAFVKGNDKKGTIKVRVHSDTSGNPARIVQLNNFNTRSSIVAAPKQILGGEMKLKFKNGGRRVKGKVSFVGSGFIEPGSFGYAASFKGKRTNLFK
jgi:hypothetical protein